MPEYRFMISGGGTGGHIFPALAIADELKRRYPKSKFQFVGAKDRMEMDKVPQAGYPIEGLWISGIQRSISLKNLSFPFKLLSSLIKSYRFIKRFQPQVVIGTGGFASGPLLYVASRLGIPALIQEQNSYPGITNKLLAAKVQSICVAYPNMERFFPANKIRLTGNPLRKDLEKLGSNTTEARQQMGLQTEGLCLLVLGGSLGARRINQLMEEIIPSLKTLPIQVIWQCGKLYEKELLAKFPEYQAGPIQIKAFIENMNSAFAASDLIISRAGANTLSELAVVAKPSILIPSPNVAEDHQTKNARSLSDRKAALLFQENRNAEELLELIKTLLADEAQRAQLSRELAKLALPKASAHIVDEIEKLMPHV
jgi:UDP-N-acetylglucosamine--N-acetylmuramyl-(pentapeptide) pyrophosphoryl-undecaprenol N-acetylglucosamine transferase